MPPPERAGGSPRLRFGTLVPTPARGVSSIVSGRAEAPGYALRTLVRTPCRGVGSAVPSLFTRGLPSCGSCV
ncbi:MAG: hypothetical protein RLZZ436_1097, partial [Planctomycetota bacterium]